HVQHTQIKRPAKTLAVLLPAKYVPSASSVDPVSRKTLGNFFRSLGPGLITGAADDDPSGITTYSIAGARHGAALLWTAWLTWPMMAAVQLVCARIGMVTGQGLTAALRRKFPGSVVRVLALLLLFVNTLN